MKSILIVEDDITYGMMLKTWLGKKGFQVASASNVSRARKHLETEKVDLILSDLRLPDHDGTDLLRWLADEQMSIPLIIMTGYADIQSAVQAMKQMSIPLIIMTGYADIQSAVQAMKMGARDYVAKPVNPDELLKKIGEALDTGTSPAAAKVKETSTEETTDFIEGESEAARQLYNYVRLVAPTNMSVLINGASGTGKEYVAHRIHRLSKRAGHPFIAIDCGSIPKELAASEFFGHVKGAFTGATSDKTGAFVEANGGTIFLDEIGNLSYEVQVQLLRALQERKVRPVGSGKEIQVDVRLVSATNENLELAIEKGLFREDLYHRINEFTLRIPTLKDRKEDIMLFARSFLNQANREMGKEVAGFDERAAQLLMGYPWPGNGHRDLHHVGRLERLARGCTRIALLAAAQRGSRKATHH